MSEIYKDHPTHLMFTVSPEGDMVNIMGPVLEGEIEDYKKDCFSPGDEIEIVSENIFKFLYPDIYRNEMLIHWTDFVEAKLTAIDVPFEFEQFEFTEEEMKDDNDSYEEMIMCERNFMIMKDQSSNSLEIYFNINCPIFWVAEITKELTLYLEGYFNIIIGAVHFKTKDGKNYFGKNAYDQHQIEHHTELLKTFNYN